VCILAEAVRIKLSERDDLADMLALIPPWFVGALFWVAISELVLKRAYPNDFIKLQTAILGADIVGDMPPGVALVAIMYDTLYAIEIVEGLKIDFVKGFVGFLEFIGLGEYTKPFWVMDE